MKKPPCRKCGRQDAVKIRYDIKADTTKQFFWFCDSCQCLATAGTFLPHGAVVPQVETLCVTAQEKFWTERIRNDYRNGISCEVCGKTGAQLHHFAPQSLSQYFGKDWHKWPTAALCIECHRRWHEIVTWYTPGYRQRQGEFALKYLEAVKA